MSDDIRIVLVGSAKEAHDKMLDAVRADEKTSINSSKLINWIVVDFFERSFEMRKKTLCREHFNSRKCVTEALRSGNPEELRKALQEAARSIRGASGSKTKKERPAIVPNGAMNSE